MPAREGGRGKGNGSISMADVGERERNSLAWSRAMPARKSAHLLNSRGV